MSSPLLTGLFLALLCLLGAFWILLKAPGKTWRGVSRTLLCIGEGYLLIHIFSLMGSLVMYGASDWLVLLTIGEGYVLWQTLTEYTRRAGLRRRVFVLHALALIGAAFFLLPFAWMISTALKPAHLAMAMPPHLWVPQPRFENFLVCMNHSSFRFLPYARNTLYLCLLSVAGTLLSSSLAAYGFSRIRWKGREILFYMTLATMMIPFPVFMVPLFRLFRYYNWVGTFKPLWIPAFFGSAFHIFLLRQFFRAIPADLSEAALMDGAGHFWLYSNIILPLAKPALVVVALFQFLYSWNDFLAPLIYLTDQNTFTLSLGLQFFQSRHGGTEWNLLMAASTLSILPVVILFIIGQKALVRGISMSGIQG